MGSKVLIQDHEDRLAAFQASLKELTGQVVALTGQVAALEVKVKEAEAAKIEEKE